MNIARMLIPLVGLLVGWLVGWLVGFRRSAIRWLGVLSAGFQRGCRRSVLAWLSSSGFGVSGALTAWLCSFLTEAFPSAWLSQVFRMCH